MNWLIVDTEKKQLSENIQIGGGSDECRITGINLFHGSLLFSGSFFDSRRKRHVSTQ